MTTIGDLTLNNIGKTRIRTRYEDATIEGVITSLGLDISPLVQKEWNGTTKAVRFDVIVDLQLGNIALRNLDRGHPCEVIA